MNMLQAAQLHSLDNMAIELGNGMIMKIKLRNKHFGALQIYCQRID